MDMDHLIDSDVDPDVTDSAEISRLDPATQHQDASTAPPLPPHLRDVSSLAAWTVSSHKPGCGVAALRHPSVSQFWQSDGPQPHFLNIHFFKFVSIAHMRVYLDHETDESYTPTKLQFLAGTGYHDLTEVCIMSFKDPKGWLDIDLSNAGGPPGLNEDSPTLRCMLIQVRILENLQNGKDTHLRGLQLFSVDESVSGATKQSQYEQTPRSSGKRPMVASLRKARREMEWIMPEPELVLR